MEERENKGAESSFVRSTNGGSRVWAITVEEVTEEEEDRILTSSSGAVSEGCVAGWCDTRFRRAVGGGSRLGRFIPTIPRYGLILVALFLHHVTTRHG